jgi:branched-chain amino acid transport system ATP-binding protein
MQTDSSDKPVLEVQSIALSFGGVTALQDVSCEVKKLEILAVIGPNGAGKTCLLNCISGFYRPQKGNITYEGVDLATVPTYKIAKLGIGRVFQGIQLFLGLSTLDNLMAARHIHMQHSVWDELIYFGKAHNDEIKHRRRVEEVIDFLEMEPIRKSVVGALPYGKRKLVDLGRALCLEPKLLLLDEPMAGMNLEEKEDVARFIVDIYERWKIPIVLVEHDMGVVMDIADRLVVLDFGKKICEGSPDVVKADPKVIEAYLGVEEEAKAHA